jgi:hypothetical protein
MHLHAMFSSDARRYVRTCYVWSPKSQSVETSACNDPRRLQATPLVLMPALQYRNDWIRGLASMIFARFGGFVFANGLPSERLRSVFTSRNEKFIFMSKPHGIFDVKHQFFLGNNIDRKPSISSMNHKGYRCAYNITLITRARHMGRQLFGMAQLLDMIRKRCLQVTKIACNVRLVSFENTTFEYQRDVMQTSHAAIFAHGAAVRPCSCHNYIYRHLIILYYI